MSNLNRVNLLLKYITAEVMGVVIKVEAFYDKKTEDFAALFPEFEQRVYIRANYESPCQKTGEVQNWKGRKHYLSDYMTDDEVVKTAYVAVKMAVEHEVMEGFKFEGKVIFNPHTSYLDLLTVSDKEVTREPHLKNEVLTLDKLNSMPSGADFAQGVCTNSRDDIYMTSRNIGKKLKWVAKRGQINDWAIYVGWHDELTFEEVLSNGDKIYNPDFIKKLVPCTLEAFNRYRF